MRQAVKRVREEEVNVKKEIEAELLSELLMIV